MSEGVAKQSSRREGWSRVVLVVGSLIFSLALAETGLRIIRPASIAFNHRQTIYEKDPLLGWRYTSNGSDYTERAEFRVPIQVNNAGFFDDDFSTDHPPDITRIAIVGDSFPAGFQVGRGFNFPDVLEARLNEAGLPACPCEVYNFGIDGTGTVQQADLLKAIGLDYQPDVVLLTIFQNDLRDVRGGLVYQEMYRDVVIAYRDDEQYEEMVALVDYRLDDLRVQTFLLERSYLARGIFALTFVEHDRPLQTFFRNSQHGDFSQLPYNSEQGLELISESVARMDAACIEAGCAFGIVLIPAKEELEGQVAPLVLALPQDVVAGDVPILDLLEPFFEQYPGDSDPLYWQHDAHWTAAGHDLAGGLIFDWLVETDFLSRDALPAE